jgi:hypothetical protein
VKDTLKCNRKILCIRPDMSSDLNQSAIFPSFACFLRPLREARRDAPENF